MSKIKNEEIENSANTEVNENIEETVLNEFPPVEVAEIEIPEKGKRGRKKLTEEEKEQRRKEKQTEKQESQSAMVETFKNLILIAGNSLSEYPKTSFIASPKDYPQLWENMALNFGKAMEFQFPDLMQLSNPWTALALSALPIALLSVKNYAELNPKKPEEKLHDLINTLENKINE